jgi:hypothetical protein
MPNEMETRDMLKTIEGYRSEEMMAVIEMREFEPASGV